MISQENSKITLKLLVSNISIYEKVRYKTLQKCSVFFIQMHMVKIMRKYKHMCITNTCIFTGGTFAFRLIYLQ